MNVLQPDLDESYTLDELTAIIGRLMAHPVLQQEGIIPALSRLQLAMAHFLLSRVGLPASVRNRILGALLLIYHGLALHDHVRDTECKPSQTVQLTILGGDYFSALFYKLLSDAGRVDLIHAFSQAIARINYAKTSLLHAPERDRYDESQFMADLDHVQGSLLYALCRSLSVEDPIRAIVQAAVSVNIYEERLLGRLPMREAVSWLTLRLQEARQKLQTLAIAGLGTDGWRQLERFTGMTLGEITTVVEGN